MCPYKREILYFPSMEKVISDPAYVTRCFVVVIKRRQKHIQDSEGLNRGV